MSKGEKKVENPSAPNKEQGPINRQMTGGNRQVSGGRKTPRGVPSKKGGGKGGKKI